MSPAQISRQRCLNKRLRWTLPESTILFATTLPASSRGSFNLIFAAFTFDNMPNAAKPGTLKGLRKLLPTYGCLFLVVSSAAIYTNQWASFSTRDFPENQHAHDGDLVRIVMLDVPDRRSVQDVFCTDACYRDLFDTAGLRVLEMHCALATGKEATRWVSETKTAAWTIHILGSASLTT